MGIFTHFKKPQDDAPKEIELPVLCYRIAYFALPQLLFADPQRTIGYFHHETIPEGALIYGMCAQVLGVEMVRLHATMFEAHSGELSPNHRYYILQYPEPLPLDMTNVNQVLAPYFSAIVQNATNEEVAYYVLGQRPNVLSQRPTGGTTFRTVMRDGTNANLGKGPAPGLSAFLDFLRTEADDAKAFAPVMPKS